MSAILKGIIDEDDLEEVNLNTYTKRERFSSYVLGKRPPEETKLIGKIGEGFPVYQDADVYGESHFYVTLPKLNRTVIYLSTNVPSRAPNVHNIDVVVASKKSPGVDKLYRFLILKKNLILVGNDQSEGARKVWKKATNHPGINVHGFNPKTGEAFHLRASDEEGYANKEERDRWRADKKKSYAIGNEDDKLDLYTKEIEDLVDIGYSSIVMHKRDKKMTNEDVINMMKLLTEGHHVNKMYVKKLSSEEELLEHIRITSRTRYHQRLNEGRSNPYCHNYKVVYSTMLARSRFINGSLTEGLHIAAGNELLNVLKKLDQFDSLDIRIGSKVSIISAQLQGNSVEFWGFLTPKTITNIHYENDHIRQFEFNNDPNDVYPKTENIEYDGNYLEDSAFFDSKDAAEKAWVWLNLQKPENLTYIDNITETTKKNKKSSIFKGIVGEDSNMQFAAEKTPKINPYGGKKDRQFRGAINEMPDTSGPVGTQPGGWRQVKLKPAGQLDEFDSFDNATRYRVHPAGELDDELDEDTSYGGGMGQGGYAGQSYRKFKPKMAGTNMKKESAIFKGIQDESTEYLAEYNRQITANQVGDRVIDALHKDSSVDLPYPLINIAQQSFQAKHGQTTVTPEQIQQWVENILEVIEARDPTPNKAYTPWLAKLYAKGGLKLEDMNRNNLLGLYDIGKRRRMIKPEHADINRFKTYNDFENAMIADYDLDAIEGSTKKEEKGKAKKVYEDENVTVIVPEDEAAACRYGRNTRWCTASTRGYNYFDSYNREGKLFILIPKNPKHEDEKYQLHFPSSQFMDEDDSQVDVYDLLTNRFPGLIDFFRKNVPEVQNNITFADNDVLAAAIDAVAEVAQEFIWEQLSEWEHEDDYYFKYLKDEGCVDEDGDVDWDKVEEKNLTYLEYNDDARRWEKRIESASRPSTDEVRKFVSSEYDSRNFHEIRHLPYVIALMIREEFSGRHDEGDAGLAKFLREKVYLNQVKNDDGSVSWKAGVIRR